MYKPSRYLNKLNHSINDHFFEDFLVVESEFKRGHEKYKLPPKTNLNFNISSSDPSQNLNNITKDFFKNLLYFITRIYGFKGIFT